MKPKFKVGDILVEKDAPSNKWCFQVRRITYSYPGTYFYWWEIPTPFGEVGLNESSLRKVKSRG